MLRRGRWRRAAWLLRCAGAWLGLVLAAPGHGQILPPDDSFRPTTDVLVRERQIPGYATSGVPVGSFTLAPRLATELDYTDNVFAFEQGKISDAFFRVTPSFDLTSNWTGKSLSLSAAGIFDRYVRRTTENVNGANASLYGTIDLGDGLRVRAIGRFRTTRESRESQNAFALTVRPILYRDSAAALGVSKQLNLLRLSVEAGVDRLDYDNGRLRDGSVLAQDYRDGSVRQFRGRAELLHSPAIATFAQVSYSSSSFSQRTPLGIRRGADTLEALAGTRFQLPILARGEIGIGYIESTYRDGRFRRFAGFAINSRVTFVPTELTNVTVTAVRSVNDAGTPESSTYVALSGGVRVDHELLRQLIIGAGVNAERDTFNGLDREDVRWTIDGSVEYRMNRTASLRFTADTLRLSSSGTARYKTFDRTRVMIGVELKV